MVGDLAVIVLFWAMILTPCMVAMHVGAKDNGEDAA